jgi:hypothetical protein
MREHIILKVKKSYSTISFIGYAYVSNVYFQVANFQVRKENGQLSYDKILNSQKNANYNQYSHEIYVLTFRLSIIV